MNLSKKRIVILWVVVILVVVFLGLGIKTAYVTNVTTGGKIYYEILTLYGQKITSDGPWKAYGTTNDLIKLSNYKYQLIVATLLIGLALFMTIKEKK